VVVGIDWLEKNLNSETQKCSPQVEHEQQDHFVIEEDVPGIALRVIEIEEVEMVEEVVLHEVAFAG
jgi:hypothetical protein